MNARRFAAALIALAFALAGCAAFKKAPETAARDAYRAAKAACAIYELSPGEKHTPDMDRTCRSLRLVCEAAP